MGALAVERAAGRGEDRPRPMQGRRVEEERRGRWSRNHASALTETVTLAWAARWQMYWPKPAKASWTRSESAMSSSARIARSGTCNREFDEEVVDDEHLVASLDEGVGWPRAS